jgi:hypothetical protein
MSTALHYHDDERAYHYTRLQNYLACPAQEACRRAGEPSLPTDAMRRGSEVHEGAARILQACVDAKRRHLPDRGAAIAAGYSGDAARLITEFGKVAEAPQGAGVEVIGVELPLTAQLPNGARFAGTCDVLYKEQRETSNPFAADDTVWTVLDWKTHVPDYVWQPEPPDQLLWYAWLVQQCYPEAQDFRVGIAGLAVWQEWRSWFWPRPETQTQLERNLGYVGERLAGIVDRMAADDRCEPHPGPACGNCCYRLACPCHDTATLQAVCGETPEGWLRKLLWHNAQADALKPLLKAHAAEHGPVHAEGKVYEGRAATSLVPRAPDLLEQDLQQYGLDREALLGGWDKRKVNSAARKLEEAQREAFLGLFEERPNNVRYGAYSATQEGDDADE